MPSPLDDAWPDNIGLVFTRYLPNAYRTYSFPALEKALSPDHSNLGMCSVDKRMILGARVEDTVNTVTITC